MTSATWGSHLKPHDPFWQTILVTFLVKKPDIPRETGARDSVDNKLGPPQPPLNKTHIDIKAQTHVLAYSSSELR